MESAGPYERIAAIIVINHDQYSEQKIKLVEMGIGCDDRGRLKTTHDEIPNRYTTNSSGEKLLFLPATTTTNSNIVIRVFIRT